MEQTAALRAEWLAQLADAIDSAQRVAWQIGNRGSASFEARELYGRLERARIELDSLRTLGQQRPIEIQRDWLERLRRGQPTIETGPTT